MRVIKRSTSGCANEARSYSTRGKSLFSLGFAICVVSTKKPLDVFFPTFHVVSFVVIEIRESYIS